MESKELEAKLLVTVDHDQEGRYGEMCDGQYECVCDDEFEPYEVPIAYTAEALIQIVTAEVERAKANELHNFIAGGRTIYESSVYQIEAPRLAARLLELRQPQPQKGKEKS